MAYKQTVLVVLLKECRRLCSSTGSLFFPLWHQTRAVGARDPDRLKMLEPNVNGKDDSQAFYSLDFTIVTYKE